MKKINNNLDFEDLIENLNLKKFIKFLDKQCKYKITNPPLKYKKPPDIYHDLVGSSVSKNMSYKKLLDGINKNEGDFIYLAIQNGTLLPHANKNFKLEKYFIFTFSSDVSSDLYGYYIISSKINKSYYVLLYYSCSLNLDKIYICLKKSKNKNLAIKFVKEENKKLKKISYYK
tara:strand:- start:46 stop:564 length:519 start_codon:yes stop_codon:yes gene_type:complete